LAGKFSLPLIRKRPITSETSYPDLIARETSQKIFRARSGTARASLEVLIHHNSAKMTDLLRFPVASSILHPHNKLQSRDSTSHFNALLDLSWAELFVPSSSCKGSDCPDSLKYASSASSAYCSNGTKRHTAYGYLIADGKDL
jgi:hypothetical protein